MLAPSHRSLRPRGVLTAILLALCVTPTLAQTRWTEASILSGGGNPLTYDSARGRAVLFAGHGETWEWDGTAWTKRNPATSPPSRCGHALAYDSVRSRVVLFGGHADYFPFQKYADTWEWDGTNWTQIATSVAPQPRWGNGLVYDSVRNKTVLFGGAGGGGNTSYSFTLLFQDTWEFDGTSWTQLSPGASPPVRFFAGFAFDRARGVAILFGGSTRASVYSDTWEWNGTSWTQRSPANSPAAREAPSFAYDAGRGRIVLFSGDPLVQPGPFSDTWEWDGSNWAQVFPAQLPHTRHRGGLAYDSSRSRIVLFGGNTGTPNYSPLTDTWEWDGATWVQRTRHHSPVSGTLAYDDARGRIVSFGGYLTTVATSSGTWEWDGTTWIERFPANSPTARVGHAVAFDSARAQLVVFGGFTGTSLFADTWVWDGTNWSQRAPAQSPPARAFHALAYDSSRGRVTLFGGLTAGGAVSDTWEWDGANWIQAAPTNVPLPRQLHALAFDSARGVVVLFGGFTGSLVLPDTWEWNGTDWALRTPATSPRARLGHTLAYDSARGRSVLFGGADPAVGQYDTWEWDGANWLQRSPSTTPKWHPGSSSAYDAGRSRTVFFSGQTWEYDAISPATYAAFGAGCAGSAGTPALGAAAGQLPWIGGTFTLRLQNLTPGNISFLLLGISKTAWGGVPLPFNLLPLGMPGCTLYSSGEFLIVIQNGGGSATFPFTLCNCPDLLGGSFYNQAFVVDASANPFGATTSNGGEGRIGAK